MIVEVQRQKQKSKSDQDRLNDLINWYEVNKPDAGKVIQVKMDVEYLNKIAVPIPNEAGRWAYRGRVLERVKT